MSCDSSDQRASPYSSIKRYGCHSLPLFQSAKQRFELELELIQTRSTQKQMLRVEVGEGACLDSLSLRLNKYLLLLSAQK